MSDYKTIKELRAEYPNLNNYILSMSDVINELEKSNLELRQSVTNLKNIVDENNKWTATVYAPNKSTYQELELKLKMFESDKQKDIDELWETRIDPLRVELNKTNEELRLSKIENSNLSTRVKHLTKVIDSLNVMINFAVGYISTTPPHTDKHPMEVKEWLFKGFGFERLNDNNN